MSLPTSLVLPAPAKLNLFLHVTGRRADGYHLLESAFTLIDLADTITMRRREDGAIVLRNPQAGVPAEADLTVRAARLLQQASGTRFGVELTLEKRIPIGGGLGGGSSDAATVLLGLNRLWQLGWTREQLQQLGLSLGADVPFFIYGQSAYVTGIGEQLSPLTLPKTQWLLVKPPVSVPTPEIFRDPHLTRNTKAAIMRVFPGAYGRNDLQAVATRKFSGVAEALAKLDDLTMSGSARMTGSGACVFAPIPDEATGQNLLSMLPYPAWIVKPVRFHPLYRFCR